MSFFRVRGLVSPLIEPMMLLIGMTEISSHLKWINWSNIEVFYDHGFLFRSVYVENDTQSQVILFIQENKRSADASQYVLFFPYAFSLSFFTLFNPSFASKRKRKQRQGALQHDSIREQKRKTIVRNTCRHATLGIEWQVWASSSRWYKRTKTKSSLYLCSRNINSVQWRPKGGWWWTRSQCETEEEGGK